MSAYRTYDPGEYRLQLGGFNYFPPVIKWIIIANVAVFILQTVADAGFSFAGIPLREVLLKYFYLWPFPNPAPGRFADFQVWQLVSYMFMHNGVWHIFFNMLLLWMFGIEVESTLGSKNFAFFYFTAGIVAGLANLFIAPMFSAPGPTLGASGGVYGVLVAFAILNPNRYVYIWFLVPVKAKYLITVLIVMELFNGVSAHGGNIAHIAHLGGAVVGAIWILLDRRGVIDKFLNGLKSPTKSTYTSTSTSSGARDAQFYEIPRPKKKEEESSSGDGGYQGTIDEILDKISKHGYGTLTEREKRILLDASKRISPDDES